MIFFNLAYLSFWLFICDVILSKRKEIIVKYLWGEYKYDIWGDHLVQTFEENEKVKVWQVKRRGQNQYGGSKIKEDQKKLRTVIKKKGKEVVKNSDRNEKPTSTPRSLWIDPRKEQ